MGWRLGWVVGMEVEVDSEMETGWRLGSRVEAGQSGRGSGWALSGNLTPGQCCVAKIKGDGVGLPEGHVSGQPSPGDRQAA